jgi:hydroxyethylthiazole kinase-like uncharacterized protein yjeF
MNDLYRYAHPILSLAEARALEAELLTDDEAAWSAMTRAGKAIAEWLPRDFSEVRIFPEQASVLVLLGKGANGGDACIAAKCLRERYPNIKITVAMIEPEATMRPLAQRAWQQLQESGRCQVMGAEEAAPWNRQQWCTALQNAAGTKGWDLCLDGLLGMSFQPPLRENYVALIEAVNTFPRIVMRAAVDLPTGYLQKEQANHVFQADFTYATGALKISQLLADGPCGRMRYCDLGFFDRANKSFRHDQTTVLNDRVLDWLRFFRAPGADKRTFGHLLVVGGSAYMPGALMMSVKAALRSGAGLVTAFTPVSVAESLAAQLPEAMWVPWPETTNGTLSPRALSLFFDRTERSNAVLIGPGMGADRFTRLIAQEVLQHYKGPILLDADALYPEVVDLVSRRNPNSGPVVLTPHHGEFARLDKNLVTQDYQNSVLAYAQKHKVSVVLKGPRTLIASEDKLVCNLHGGPVLSRGGSGDILAGILAGLLARRHDPLLETLASGVFWHARAAEMLAREQGQVCVQTTDLLNYMGLALRNL